MKQPLEKAISSSRKGCIDDHDEIDKIFTKLIEMPMVQLGGAKYKYVLDQITSLLTCWEMPSDDTVISSITVGEFFGLVKELKDDPTVYLPAEIEISRRCYYAFLFGIEQQLQQSENCTVRLFRYFSINAFLHYAAQKTGCSKSKTNSFYRVFRRDVKHTMGLSIEDDTTIQEYMKKLFMFQRKSWMPNQPISDFEKEIRESYDEFSYLVFESAKLTFPEMFDTETIIRKYKDPVSEICNEPERNDEQWQIF